MATKVTLNINRPDWKAWVDTLTERKPFTTGGSLRGEPGGAVSTGRMGAYDLHTLTAHGAPDYVIYSYSTPIAWHHAGAGWTIGEGTYSVTTRKQLGRVRTALSMAGLWD